MISVQNLTFYRTSFSAEPWFALNKNIYDNILDVALSESIQSAFDYDVIRPRGVLENFVRQSPHDDISSSRLEVMKDSKSAFIKFSPKISSRCSSETKYDKRSQKLKEDATDQWTKEIQPSATLETNNSRLIDNSPSGTGKKVASHQGLDIAGVTDCAKAQCDGKISNALPGSEKTNQDLQIANISDRNTVSRSSIKSGGQTAPNFYQDSPEKMCVKGRLSDNDPLDLTTNVINTTTNTPSSVHDRSSKVTGVSGKSASIQRVGWTKVEKETLLKVVDRLSAQILADDTREPQPITAAQHRSPDLLVTEDDNVESDPQPEGAMQRGGRREEECPGKDRSFSGERKIELDPSTKENHVERCMNQAGMSNKRKSHTVKARKQLRTTSNGLAELSRRNSRSRRRFYRVSKTRSKKLLKYQKTLIDPERYTIIEYMPLDKRKYSDSYGKEKAHVVDSISQEFWAAVDKSLVNNMLEKFLLSDVCTSVVVPGQDKDLDIEKSEEVKADYTSSRNNLDLTSCTTEIKSHSENQEYSQLSKEMFVERQIDIESISSAVRKFNKNIHKSQNCFNKLTSMKWKTKIMENYENCVENTQPTSMPFESCIS